MTTKYRIEKDTMGEVRVPAKAYYGAQTQRAVENFPVSGLRMPARLIRALGLIKKAAAEVNLSKKQLAGRPARAIIRAAREVIDGRLDAQFPVDVFQTGSGTSTNMNANEVIAARANKILGGRAVHPNDHVNRGQSSNDVIPTAIHIAAMEGIERDLLPTLRKLHKALARKADRFDSIVKIGRTHLADATPIRLGQEFGGFASMVEHGIRRVENARPHLCELALGGTAVGTGINAPRGFAAAVIARIARATGIPFVEAPDHFEAQAAQDALVETSGALRSVAISLMNIADNLRWLASGPRCGIAEIALPELQPGSSIMPGKVNPVIPEAVLQVGAQVIGNDAAIAAAARYANFQLLTMLPVMAHNLLQSIGLLANVSVLFADRCVNGIKADPKRCAEMVERSLAMCTSLAPRIGYEAAAAIAKRAYSTGRTVREVAREMKVLDEKTLKKLLDPRRMTGQSP